MNQWRVHIWRCPKVGVLPNNPFKIIYIRFSMIFHYQPFWDTSIYGKPKSTRALTWTYTTKRPCQRICCVLLWPREYSQGNNTWKQLDLDGFYFTRNATLLVWFPSKLHIYLTNVQIMTGWFDRGHMLIHIDRYSWIWATNFSFYDRDYTDLPHDLQWIKLRYDWNCWVIYPHWNPPGKFDIMVPVVVLESFASPGLSR